jgi:hypothetical protein
MHLVTNLTAHILPQAQDQTFDAYFDPKLQRSYAGVAQLQSFAAEAAAPENTNTVSTGGAVGIAIGCFIAGIAAAGLTFYLVGKKSSSWKSYGDQAGALAYSLSCRSACRRACWVVPGSLPSCALLLVEEHSMQVAAPPHCRSGPVHQGRCRLGVRPAVAILLLTAAVNSYC